MKALVFYNKGDVRYEENWRDPPPPKAGEVTVAIDWCAICGTDIEDYRFGGVIPVDAPHPGSGVMAPIVLGHEFSGHVAALGDGVRNVTKGQAVAIECVVGCKTCEWCLKQNYALCEKMVSYGQQCDGGIAEYMNIPAENCIPVPEGSDMAHLSLAEPLAVMVRAMRKGRVAMGDTVTIVGAGAIGLCGIAAARAAGAYKVISLTHGGRRAQVAATLGADLVLDTRQDGWLEEYLAATDGRYSDVVVDAGGNVASMRQAFDLTKRGGRCVIASVSNQEVPIPAMELMLGEKEIIGSVAHTHLEEFKWSVAYLLDGRVDLRPIITDKIYIADSVEMALERSITDRDQIKILITANRSLL